MLMSLDVTHMDDIKDMLHVWQDKKITSKRKQQIYHLRDLVSDDESITPQQMIRYYHHITSIHKSSGSQCGGQRTQSTGPVNGRFTQQSG
jgi:hypothetical protein